MNIANINNANNPYLANNGNTEKTQQNAESNPLEQINKTIQTDTYTPGAERTLTNNLRTQAQAQEELNTENRNTVQPEQNPAEENNFPPAEIQAAEVENEAPEAPEVREENGAGVAENPVRPERNQPQPPEAPENEAQGNPNQNPTLNIVA